MEATQLNLFEQALADVTALCFIEGGEMMSDCGLRLGSLALLHRRTQDPIDRALEKLRNAGRDILELVRQGNSWLALPVTLSRVYLFTAPLDAANYAVIAGVSLDGFKNWLEVASLNQLGTDILPMRVLAMRASCLGKPDDPFLPFFAKVDAQITGGHVEGVLGRPSGKVQALYKPDAAKAIEGLLQQPVSPMMQVLRHKIALYKSFRDCRDPVFAMVPMTPEEKDGRKQVDYALRIARTHLDDPAKERRLAQAKEETCDAGMAFLSHMLAALFQLKVHEKGWLYYGPGCGEIANVYVHTMALRCLEYKREGFANWLEVAASLLAKGDAFSYAFLADLAAVRKDVKSSDDDPYPTRDANDLMTQIQLTPALEGMVSECAALKELFVGLKPVA